jgi:hypothetical protein
VLNEPEQVTSLGRCGDQHAAVEPGPEEPTDGFAGSSRAIGSDGPDVLGFLALATRADLELNGLTFCQRGSLGLEVGDVHEDVLAAFPGDETESTVLVEELHFALHKEPTFSFSADRN